MAKTTTPKKSNGNNSALGFEATLWATADKLRGNLDAAEYKHVVLGLIFLKYIYDAGTKLRMSNVECRIEPARAGATRAIRTSELEVPSAPRSINSAQGISIGADNLEST